MLYTEMQAAETFHLDPDFYFTKSRESRMAMVAYVISKSAVKSMQEYDMAKKAEADMKRKRKR